MSLTSKYTIDLIVKDDESKASINELERSLKNVSQYAQNAGKGSGIADEIERASAEAQKAALQLNKIAMSSEDCSEAFEAYQKHAAKAEQSLQAQVLHLKHSLSEEGKLERVALKRLRQAAEGTKNKKEQQELLKKIKSISARVVELSDEEIQAAIKKNQQARLTLKTAVQSAKLNKQAAKQAVQEQKQEKARAKSGLAWLKQLMGAKKGTSELVKGQTQLLGLVTNTAKQQKAVTSAIKDSERAQSRLAKISKGARNGLQNAYHAAGLVGGAARMIKGGASMISGVVRDGVSAAETELEKEREARRIKGYYGAEAVGILNELYLRTGADYSTIVEALNRVQATLKPSSKEELLIGAGIELRNPGASLAFASSQTAPSLQLFAAYERRIEGIQKATGASAAQIEASTQKMASFSGKRLGNSSVTQMQALYLALQNSGAFVSEEELDRAFERFIRSRQGSKQNIIEDAQNYDWAARESNSRLALRLNNTLRGFDWQDLKHRTNYIDTLPQKQSENESVSEQMRRIEFQKNQLILKLLPAIMPLIDGLSKLLSSEAGEKIIKGLLKFMEVVVPILADIFISLAKTVGVIAEKVTEIASEGAEALNKMTNRRIESHGAPAWMANGGIALGTTIAGERGPEAIIPLDYSRTQRAENIAFSIQNNFSMAGNQTTALALAEAVSSRDFSRAMSRNAFIATRTGGF